MEKSRNNYNKDPHETKNSLLAPDLHNSAHEAIPHHSNTRKRNVSFLEFGHFVDF